MNALYLLTRVSVAQGNTSPTSTNTSIPDEPLLEIRPGAFSRWIAEVEAAAADGAQADRGGSATTEGIAATRPEGLPEGLPEPA